MVFVVVCRGMASRLGRATPRGQGGGTSGGANFPFAVGQLAKLFCDRALRGAVRLVRLVKNTFDVEVKHDAGSGVCCDVVILRPAPPPAHQ